MHDLENELLIKVYELQHKQSAMRFQMSECLTFLREFRKNKQNPVHIKECQDDDCEWTKEVELWNLSQRQIVHVMFYHTKDYMDIASSERRAVRFREAVEHVRPTKPKTDNS
eukprot:526211_1